MATPTYVQIATTTLASSASSVLFAGIPTQDLNGNDLRDLVLVVWVSSGMQGKLQYNGDTSTSNYSFVYMRGTGSSAQSNSGTVDGYELIDTASANSMAIVQIMDYSATDKHKSTLNRSDNAAARTVARAGRWASTSAITSLSITGATGNFAAGSTFSLFGIAGVAV